MTILEKKSKRKALAIKRLVESGEYSAQYALDKVEELNDAGQLLDVDYEPLAEWLEAMLAEPIVEPSIDEEVPEEEVVETEEPEGEPEEGDVEDDNE